MRLKEYIIITCAAIVLALVLKTFVIDVVQIPSPSMETTLLPGDFVVVNKLIHGRTPEDSPSGIASFFRLPTLRTIRTGDIVLFRLPFLPHEESDHPLFVKRCVAVPGDMLTLDSSVLSVNRRPIARINNVSTFVFKADLREPMILPARGDVVPLTPATFGRWSDLIKSEGHVVSLRGGNITVDGAAADRYTVRQNYYFMLGDNTEHSYDSRSWGLLQESMVEGTIEFIYWSVDQSNPAGSGFLPSVRWNRIGHFVQ